MFRFANLIIKNLGRNKLRTSLTAMAVMILVAIYAIVSVVTDTISRVVGSYSSQNRLIVRERWVQPSRFPAKYLPKIARVEGVEDWTTWAFYVGELDNKGNRLGGLATRIDNIHEMHPGFEEFDTSLIDKMAREKTGVLMGKAALAKYGWKVGQKFTMQGVVHPGKNLEFKIVGVLPSELWGNTFFFRHDYYEDATGDDESVNVMWLRVRTAEAGQRVGAEVQQMFENSPAQLRVETESAGISRISGRLQTTVNIINFVTSILLLDMVVILSNSISMTVRERRKEMAILKVIGFSPGFIMTLVIGEAMFVGALSGGLGAFLSFAFCAANSAHQLPFYIEYLNQFPVTIHYLPHGFIIGALVGLIGSVLPAWNVQKVQIATVFSAGG